MRHNLDTQGGAEQGHDPFVNVLLRLYFFHLKVLAQVRQVDLENLLEQLESLGHELFVKGVEGHHRILQH